MKLMFDKDDMLNFIKWYDGKKEENCHATFEMELIEWMQLQEKTTQYSCIGCKYGPEEECTAECNRHKYSDLYKKY